MSKQQDWDHPVITEAFFGAGTTLDIFHGSGSYMTIDNDVIVMMLLMILMMMTMLMLTKVILMLTTSLCRLIWHGEPVQLLCGFVPVLTRQRYELAPSNDPHLCMEQNTNRIYIFIITTQQKETYKVVLHLWRISFYFITIDLSQIRGWIVDSSSSKL